MYLASNRGLRSGLVGLVLAATVGAGCRHRAAPSGDGAPIAEGGLDGGPAAGAATTDGAATAPPPAARGKQIAILYASDLGAEVEACSCPVHPMGGLARRATQIDRARAESDAVVVLDAGDLLRPAAARLAGRPPPDRGEVERRARLMAAAVARSGISAMTPGDSDLALGLPLLRRLANDPAKDRPRPPLPLVSANLRGPDGALLFDADRLIDAGGLKVGIFGVTMPPTAADAAAWRAAGIEARDAAVAARDAAAALRARGAQVVIALLHVPSAPEARRLLEATPGIDWAVVGHAGMHLESPEKAGQTQMLAALADGKELGRLDLHVVNGGVRFTDRGERAELATILADHRRQLVDYDRRLGDTDPASVVAYYEQRRRDIEKAIAREQAALDRLPRAIAGSWFENRLIPLDAATPDQTGVAMLVDAYKRESTRRAAAGKPVGVGTESPPSPPPSATAAAGPAPAPAGTFVGTTVCGSCHAPALAFWKTTKHARALAALARIGRDRDPACVGCHVTGYLQPTGWRLDAPAAQRAPLENVSCEVCHGAGKRHVEAADKKTSTSRAVPEAVCLGCHTPDITNGEFDYRRFTEAILGPGHGKPTAVLAPGVPPPL